MADNIFGQRFFNRSNTPAWHGKGVNQTAALTATAALEKIGNYNVRLESLPVMLNGAPTPSGYSMIVREATPDDPTEHRFGSPVLDNYELITPSTAAQIWDETVLDVDGETLPVETLGVLDGGKELFITSKIVRFAVAGDDIDMYIGFHSPMNSNHASHVFSTAVRIVCQNTLKIGLKGAAHKRIIPHTPGAIKVVREWLGKIYQQQSGIIISAKVDMEKMAATQVKSAVIMDYLKAVYPDPDIPNENWVGQFSPNTTLAQYQANYDTKLAKVNVVRDTIVGLFAGDGVGSDTRAANGTLFGLYNAVAEFEDNRMGASNESTVRNVLVGDRGDVIAKAYRLAVNWN